MEQRDVLEHSYGKKKKAETLHSNLDHSLSKIFVHNLFFSLLASFMHNTHARAFTHTGSDNPEMDIFVRLHGSHSARPMERERHFNLPAHYFITFLITCFFVVFPEGRGVSVPFFFFTFDDLEVDELISNSWVHRRVKRKIDTLHTDPLTPLDDR